MSGVTIGIVVAALSSPVLGVVLTAYLRPRRTPAEELDQVRADRAEDRDRLDAVEARFDRLSDYVHQLRQHIAEDKGPPPPPWPEGIRQ